MLAVARLELSRGNRERALELTVEAEQLARDMTDPLDQQVGVYELLAARWGALDDGDRAEPFISKMLEIEGGLSPRRPRILGTRHLFYAKFLFERRRFTEAGIHARAGLALYEEGVGPHDGELALIRRDMAAVLRAAEEPS